MPLQENAALAPRKPKPLLSAAARYMESFGHSALNVVRSNPRLRNWMARVTVAGGMLVGSTAYADNHLQCEDNTPAVTMEASDNMGAVRDAVNLDDMPEGFRADEISNMYDANGKAMLVIQNIEDPFQVSLLGENPLAGQVSYRAGRNTRTVDVLDAQVHNGKVFVVGSPAGSTERLGLLLDGNEDGYDSRVALSTHPSAETPILKDGFIFAQGNGNNRIDENGNGVLLCLNLNEENPQPEEIPFQVDVSDIEGFEGSNYKLDLVEGQLVIMAGRHDKQFFFNVDGPQVTPCTDREIDGMDSGSYTRSVEAGDARVRLERFSGTFVQEATAEVDPCADVTCHLDYQICVEGMCVNDPDAPECSEDRVCTGDGMDCIDGTCEIVITPCNRDDAPNCLDYELCEDDLENNIAFCVEDPNAPECSIDRACVGEGEICIEGTCTVEMVEQDDPDTGMPDADEDTGMGDPDTSEDEADTGVDPTDTSEEGCGEAPACAEDEFCVDITGDGAACLTEQEICAEGSTLQILSQRQPMGNQDFECTEDQDDAGTGEDVVEPKPDPDAEGGDTGVEADVPEPEADTMGGADSGVTPGIDTGSNLEQGGDQPSCAAVQQNTRGKLAEMLLAAGAGALAWFRRRRRS